MTKISINQTSSATRDGHLKIKDGLPISSSLQIVADEFNTDTAIQLSTLVLKAQSSEQCPLEVESTGAGGGISLMDNTTTDADSVGIGAFGDDLCFRSGGSAAGNMRLTAAGNLGIGTNSPDHSLQIERSNAQHLSLSRSGVGSFSLGVVSSDALVFQDDGSERMRIDSSGNVGINDISSGSIASNYAPKLLVGGSIVARSLTANEALIAIGGDATSAYINAGKQDGSLTSRDLRFENGASESMRLDSSGNLGIGVSSPSAKLDVAGQIITSNSIRFTGNVGTPTGNTIFRPTSNTIAIGTGSVEAMRIDSNQNVGIGVSTPTARLEISSPNQGDVYLEGGTADSRQLRFSTFANISDHAGHLINASSTNGAIAFATGGSEAMRINSNQDVGIGTSSPSRKLHVSEAVNGDIALFTNTIDADLNINLSSGVTLLSPSTTTLAFGTSSTERMRIDSSGNLGIGTSSPSGKLQIYSDADVTYSSSTFPSDLVLSRINTSGNNQVVGINFQCTGDSGVTTGNAAISAVQTGLLSSADLVFQNRDNGVRIETMRIASDGKVGIGTSSPNRELTVNGEIEATNLVLTNALYVGGTAASNALDDYEEGTWTPVFTGSTTPPTGFVANFLSGSYTKIGRQVVARFGVNVNNVGTGGAGTLRVTGLPFVGANIGAYQEPTAPANGGRWVTAANAGNVYAFVVNGQSYADFRTMASNSDTALTYSELQGGSASVGTWFTMVVTYFV